MFRASSTATLGPIPYQLSGNVTASTGVPRFTITWNSVSFDSYYKTFAPFTWKNPLGVILLNDGLAYSSTIVTGTQRSFGTLTMTFAKTAAATPADQTASIGTAADMTWVIPRRHANDKMTIVFKNATLLHVEHKLAHNLDEGSYPVMVCTWGGITDVEVTIQQVLADGTTDNPDAAADYEAVS